MKIVSWVLIVLALAIGVSANDAADSAVASKIMAMEKAWNQAFKLRDTKAINELLDDSIILVNDDGSMQSKSEFLTWIRTSKPSDDEQVSPESISVHVTGDVAVATGTFRAKSMQGGKSYLRQDRFVDTWVNKNGAWVCLSATATSVSH